VSEIACVGKAGERLREGRLYRDEGCFAFACGKSFSTLPFTKSKQ
jgi:hypothetical protein